MRSASIFVIIRSCKLTSLLPFVFPPVYTTMSSTSGEVPAERSVVGSIGGHAASEEPHIILQMVSFFLLVTFLLTSPPLLVFLSR